MILNKTLFPREAIFTHSGMFHYQNNHRRSMATPHAVPRITLHLYAVTHFKYQIKDKPLSFIIL